MFNMFTLLIMIYLGSLGVFVSLIGGVFLVCELEGVQISLFLLFYFPRAWVLERSFFGLIFRLVIDESLSSSRGVSLFLYSFFLSLI